RDGKEITTLPHLRVISDHLTDQILDGELYIHGENFQANMTLIKKNQPGTEKVGFNCYDLVMDLPYSERREELLKIIKNLKEIDSELNITNVESKRITT